MQRVDTVIEDAEPVEKKRKKEELKGLEEYKDVFEGLGNLPGEHRIKLKENAAPVIEACRKIPISLQEKVKTELKRMEEEGVIEKVTEPTKWVNSMVIVHKAYWIDQNLFRPKESEQIHTERTLQNANKR